jgi:hypothetical protein
MALPEIKVKITADTTNAEISIDRVIKSEKELALATTEAARKMTALNAALAKGSITQKNYAREVAKVDREFDAAAASAARLVGATAQVTRTSAGAAGAVARTSGAMGRLGSVSNQTRSRIQNTSFQLQDIIVQLQMGTRVSTTLSQQLPQLAGAFGAVGAAIGVGVALGIPAVALAMNAMRTASVTLEERMEALEELSDKLTATLDILKMSVSELSEEYAGASERVRELAALQAGIQIAAATAAFAGQAEMLKEVSTQFITSSESGGRFESTIGRITEAFGTSRTESIALEAALQELYTAEGFEAQQGALEGLSRLMREFGVDASKLPPEFSKALSEMIDLSRETDGARAIADQLVEAVADIAPNLAPATDAATLLKEEMAAALALINKVSQQSSLTYSGRGGDPSSFGNDFTNEQGYQSPAEVIAAAQASSGRSTRTTPSGGGQDRDPAIEALMESLKTEDEVLEEWRAAGLETLSEANAQELEALGGHAEAKLRLEAQYQDQLATLRDGANSHELKARKTTMDAAIGLIEQFGSKNKVLAKAAIVLNAAQRVSEIQANTAAAAVRALAELGPIAGPPAAARIAAFGAVQTGIAVASAALRMGSVGGGGGGGSAGSIAPSGSSSQSSTQSAPSGSPTNVAISLQGGDMFGRDQVISLINSINEAVEDGAIVRLV